MRSKMLILHKMLRLRTTPPVNIRRMYGMTSEPYCEAHMNELPVPCGPWDEAYTKRQSFYNKILLSGIAWFLGSMALAFYLGALNFNFAAPAMPGPPPDYVDAECDDSC